MDVKGAKALSERLAEAARSVEPPPAKAVNSGDTEIGTTFSWTVHDVAEPGVGKDFFTTCPWAAGRSISPSLRPGTSRSTPNG